MDWQHLLQCISLASAAVCLRTNNQCKSPAAAVIWRIGVRFIGIGPLVLEIHRASVQGSAKLVAACNLPLGIDTNRDFRQYRRGFRGHEGCTKSLEPGRASPAESG